MRLLHVIATVNPAGGGPIEGLKQLAAANRKAGHTVAVVSMDAPSSEYVRNCPLTCYAMGPSLGSYGYSSSIVPWLRAHAREYDAVVVNGLWGYSSFAVWRALHGSSTPYFVFTHGMLDPWFKRTYPLKHLKKWLYWPWAEYRVLRDARAVLFTCEDERRLAKESFWLYRCNERTVKYGTPGPGTMSPSAIATQSRAFLDRFPALLDKRCLLFLGRVHVKKGPDLLFRAFSNILATLPADQAKTLHLVMAGPANHAYGREMMRLASELNLDSSITWTGMLTGDEKWGAFRSADAFVLPSHQENFGIAVAESLACGLPVLISNQVNIWREIDEDMAGYIEDDTFQGTVNLIRRWLKTPREVWKEMRVRSQICFEQRFRIDGAAKSLIDTLLDCGVRDNEQRKSTTSETSSSPN